MDRLHKLNARRVFFGTALLLLGTVAGCGTFAQFMYAIKGMEVKAAYAGLKDSKVAIVVVSDASSYGPDSLTRVVGRALGARLSSKVKDITVINHQTIENWQDTHGWNEIDFVALGKGVKADKVLAIEIDSYSIREGSTMFKGRSMITTSVYDIANDGQIVFSQGPGEFQFPKSHGRPAISTNPQRFEAAYLSMLVDSIARNFHKHDRTDTVADDAIEFD